MLRALWCFLFHGKPELTHISGPMAFPQFHYRCRACGREYSYD
jgi:hypothetical protein